MSGELLLEFEENTFALKPGNLYLIGRKGKGSGAAYLALDNESVDDKHAAIEIVSDSANIIDLYSASGTYINGQRLEPLVKTILSCGASLHIGSLSGKLLLTAAEESHDSSGFHDGLKNTSDIILSSPESVSQHRSKFLNNNFIVPTAPAVRKSTTSNTTTNAQRSFDGNESNDSFSIPETQYPQTRRSLGQGDISIADSDIGCNNNQSLNSSRVSDGECIPETQEPVVAFRSSQRPKTYQENNDAILDANLPKHLFDEDEVRTSQFRICTQDFNENCFGNDSNSSDLLDDIQCSLVIQRIQHPPVLISESGNVQATVTTEQQNGNVANDKSKENADDDIEMCALNWSAPTSKCTTLNDTAAETANDLERFDACTPDLFDFPDLATLNRTKAAENVNDSKKSSSNTTDINITNNSFSMPEAPIASAKKSTATITTTPQQQAVNLPLIDYDDDDLIPTQVFIQPEKQTAKATPVHLTLSDKENMLPSAAPTAALMDIIDNDNQPTQLFIPNEGVSAAKPTNKVNTSIKNPTTIVCNLYEEEIDDDFLPTQVFPVNKSKCKVVEKTTKATATTSKICHNSTLLYNDGTKAIRNAASFFEDMEKTPQKNKFENGNELINKFKKPEVALLKKTASMSSTTSTMGSQSDVDLLMCTPQLIKDQFFERAEDNIKDNKQSLIAIKHKTLFGDDSEEEEEDVLKLINAPKISHDFEKLLPHLKENPNTPKTKEEEDIKIRQFNMFNRKSIQERDKEAKNKPSSTKSRDERHTARDKERIQADQNIKKQKKEKNHSAAEEQSDTNAHSSRKRKDAAEKETAAKKHKTALKSENIEKKTLTNAKKVDVESNEQLNKLNNPNSKKTTKKVNKKDVEQADEPTKRKTRLRSRVEETSPTTVAESSIETVVEQPKVKNTREKKSSKSTTDKQHKMQPERETRSTRSRSQTESQESINSSSSATAEKTNKERKRKSSIQPEDNQHKRLRNNTCLTSSGSNSKKSALKLKVSMTMVDPEHFQNLAQNCSDIWTVAKDPAESDILIMDKGNRTFKFLVAMAKGIPILTSKWLESVNQTKSAVRLEEHFFTDLAFEKRHKFSLLKSLELARRTHIFAGYEFILTPSIQPQPEEIKTIIKCAGGTVHVDLPTSKDPNQKLYLVSTASDKKHWHKYRRVNGNIRIVSTEGVMASVMRQLVKPLDTNLLA